MTNLTVRTPDVSTKSIPQDTVAALRTKVRGVVALPGEDGYDAARTIWTPNRSDGPWKILRLREPRDSRQRSP